MSGPFRKAIDEIAIRAAENGGPTAQDLLTAMIAGHDEAEQTAAELAQVNRKTAETLAAKLEEQHQASISAIVSNRQLLADHLDEAKERDRRITALEGWRAVTEENCEARVKRICSEEHAKTHSDYLESLVEEGKSFSLVERRVWVIWGVAIFVAVIIAQAMLTIGIDKVLRP